MSDFDFYGEVSLLLSDRTRRELLRVLVKSEKNLFNRSSLLKRLFASGHNLSLYTFNVILNDFESKGYIEFGEPNGRFGCKHISVLPKGNKRFQLIQVLLKEMDFFLLEKAEGKKK